MYFVPDLKSNLLSDVNQRTKSKEVYIGNEITNWCILEKNMKKSVFREKKPKKWT